MLQLGMDKFITEFCKVDVVCWNLEPNWAGWFIIIIAAFIIFGIIGSAVVWILDQ